MLYAQRLRNNIAHLHPLIQAGIGILKNDLPLRLKHFPVFPKRPRITGINPLEENSGSTVHIASFRQVFSAQPSFSRGRSTAIWTVQIHDAAGHRRFSRAGFPNQSEDLTPFYLKRDIVDRLECLPVQWKHMRKMPYIQQDFLRFHIFPVPPTATGRHLCRRKDHRRCDLRSPLIQQPCSRIVRITDAK